MGGMTVQRGTTATIALTVIAEGILRSRRQFTIKPG
jgi:hypothetical protein